MIELNFQEVDILSTVNVSNAELLPSKITMNFPSLGPVLGFEYKLLLVDWFKSPKIVARQVLEVSPCITTNLERDWFSSKGFTVQ